MRSKKNIQMTIYLKYTMVVPYTFHMRTVLLIFSICTVVLFAKESSQVQGVDLLYQLGLVGSKERHTLGVTSVPSSAPSPPPQGIFLPGAGVVLRSGVHIESPISGLLPTGTGDEFSIVVCLSSWRVNNAFLVSITNSKNRLQFGIQLLPKKVVVYIAEKTSVYFRYNVHNGRWHSFAIGVRPRSVSFHAECGGVYYSEETLTRPQKLDPDGLLTLGRMNFRAVQFEGEICQLDIYPSAQAAANYCNYIKKQCRLADTYRSLLPSLTSEFNDPTLSDHPLKAQKFLSPLLSTALPNHRNISESGTASIPSTESYEVQNQYVESRASFRPVARTELPLWPSNMTVDSSSEGSASVQATLDVSPSSTPSLVGADEAEIRLPEPDHEVTSLPKIPDATDITPGTADIVRPEPRNNSGPWQPTNELIKVQPKISSTLYRDFLGNENQVDDSDDHSLEMEYDVDMGNYDYGYEEAEYSLNYDGLQGSKGDPGPPVSARLHICR
uniref:Thrombospondin-like N-terminal domain-containing protein n=1 Tax=Scleropages formosus TaxID=113540 RepID=A0A8C9T7K9_SCLFO